MPWEETVVRSILNGLCLSHIYPRCSMVLEYVPTFARTKCPSYARGKYCIHGAYGYCISHDIYWMSTIFSHCWCWFISISYSLLYTQLYWYEHHIEISKCHIYPPLLSHPWHLWIAECRSKFCTSELDSLAAAMTWRMPGCRDASVRKPPRGLDPSGSIYPYGVIHYFYGGFMNGQSLINDFYEYQWSIFIYAMFDYRRVTFMWKLSIVHGWNHQKSSLVHVL